MKELNCCDFVLNTLFIKSFDWNTIKYTYQCCSRTLFDSYEECEIARTNIINKKTQYLFPESCNKRINYDLPKKTTIIALNISEFCNFSCYFCCTGIGNNLEHKKLKNKEQRTKNKEYLIHQIDEVIKKNKDVLYLESSNGDIYYDELTLEVYNYFLNKYNLKAKILTNLYAFTTNKINILKYYMIDVSVFGGNNNEYKKCCQVDDGFTKVLNNIIILLKYDYIILTIKLMINEVTYQSKSIFKSVLFFKKILKNKPNKRLVVFYKFDIPETKFFKQFPYYQQEILLN